MTIMAEIATTQKCKPMTKVLENADPHLQSKKQRIAAAKEAAAVGCSTDSLETCRISEDEEHEPMEPTDVDDKVDDDDIVIVDKEEPEEDAKVKLGM